MLVLLGKISCFIDFSPTTSCSKRKTQKEREKARLEYFLEGKKICRETFKFLHSSYVNFEMIENCIILHNFSLSSASAITAWMHSSSITLNMAWLRRRRSQEGERTTRRPSLLSRWRTPSSSWKTMLLTMHLCCLEGCLALNGMTSCFSHHPTQGCSCTTLTKKLWKKMVIISFKYCSFQWLWSCCLLSEEKMIGISSFKSIWRRLVPFVVTCKPMTDLCATCQGNNYLIYRSANQTEQEKW